MKHDEAVDTLLSYADIQTDSLDDDSARRLVDALGFDAATRDDLVHELSRIAYLDGEKAPHGEFEFRVGTWCLDLTREGTRIALMTAVLSASLAALDVKTAGVAMLSAIVPSVLEIERVDLSPGENRLLIEVRRLPSVTDEQTSIDDLYDALPDDVRSTVNRFDFADFVGTLRRAGLAEMDDQGTEARIRSANERTPLIQWR